MSYRLQSDMDPNQTTVIDATDDGNGLLLRHEVNTRPLLDQNQKLRSVIGRGITRNHDALRPVARISGVMLMDLMRKGVLSEDPYGSWHVLDEKKLRAFLNNRDYSKLRVSEGKV